VLIVRLLINPIAQEKLARRGIYEDEVDQLRHNGPWWERNPRPRAPGSRFLIGPTDGGRLLTVVVVPDAADQAIWHVQTGWDSTKRERAIYLQRG
jgi:hypothetical protein